MLHLIREIESPGKTTFLQAVDTILRPLNIVVNCSKVIKCGKREWQTEERTQNLALLVISFVASCVFMPLILATLIIKSAMPENKWRYGEYMLAKKESSFQKRGYNIKLVTHDVDGFSLVIESKLHRASSFTVEYSCYGRLKGKKLFDQDF
jgi:hypothetical protein